MVSVQPSSSIEFIGSTFSDTGMGSLSYKHQELKWLISEHLLSLFYDFCLFIPSAENYIHNDGIVIRLLNVSSYLTVPPSKLPILMTIWLKEDYPFPPPLVYILPHSVAKIHHQHPFIDPSSCSTNCPYMETWKYPRSNLSDLTHEILEVLKMCTLYPDFVDESLEMIMTNRNDIEIQLARQVHHDKRCFRAQVEEDIEYLLGLQGMLLERADTLNLIIHELEKEEMTNDDIEDVLDVVDEASKFLIKSEAADRPIDDVMEIIWKEVEEGRIEFREYLKQIRNLAREQFFHKALIIELGT
ncbi:Vacuolar sorting protein/ubiquitin receptor VPS23 protein [Dioscorea alata]|uniref:Vacuolar sorting protein/ubiquitin receptor VPS23 protein n=1 Tax=Dioscorea alata TaxID=55571 RepID=A0ACB7UYE7_DIOAL|nr:Vacuolar sorting protein/ubiquitin receptor VPS23 protein [Dioscorea alata]